MKHFIEHHWARLIRSVMVGAVGSVIALSIQWVLTEWFGWWYIFSGIIGLGTGALNNYFLNYYWSFKDVIKEEKK